MELRHLRYFVAVAEELHFGHAASRLNTSQSSLSQQIKNLETELKVDLLARTRRHVELTPAGRRFLQEAQDILAAAERAAGLARETARGEARKLVIGISPDTDWLLLGKALRLWAEHVPSVDVLFQNLTPEAQVDALREGRIDIGFVGLPLEAEGLVTEMTGRVRLMVVRRAAAVGRPTGSAHVVADALEQHDRQADHLGVAQHVAAEPERNALATYIHFASSSSLSCSRAKILTRGNRVGSCLAGI